MVTTMRILGWKAQGLRCPDHEINCLNRQGQVFRTSLIQMPNGTGKTTTLLLLRAALSGSAANGGWGHARVKELRKKGSNEPNGLFELRLSRNDKRITITMEFDFESGHIAYKTTRGSGQEDGFNPPPELRRFMDEDFVYFYVFDGELAENLLSKQHTHAEKAVESLFQIHLLRQMADKVSGYWDEKTRNVSAKDEKGFTRRKNKLDQWRNRRMVLKVLKFSSKQDHTELTRQLKAQEDTYKQEITKEEDRAKKINDAEDTVAKLKEELRVKATSVLDGMRDPQALSPIFATFMFDLKSGLDRVKLPESAAREFFEELSEESECVCGRPIDEAIRTIIQVRAQQYLGSEDVSLLNAMKSAVADAVGQSRHWPARDLTNHIDELSDLVSKLHTSQNDLDALKYTAEQTDPDLRKAKEEIDRLKLEKDRIESELQRFEGIDEMVQFDRIHSVDPKRIFSIKTIQEGIKFLEDQVDEVAGTLKLRQKRDELIKVINGAHAKARRSITSEIRSQANQRIEALMPYNSIRIAAIDGCLKLSGQTGGSVGETLSVGYAFLATLFHRAEQHQLPFVVDSPANPIDLEIRSNIGELVPNLTGQFIAFMISSEREKFLDGLKKASNTDIQFITLFRKGASHLETKASANSSCVATKDGFRVVDEEFFNEFQLDVEEA